MTYLVDSTILSEATKPCPNPHVMKWLRDHEQEIAVDTIILGELRFGILLMDNGPRKKRLERWFARGVGRLRTLPWKSAVGLRWAQLLAELRKKGKAIPSKDSMIAATALVNNLTVVTKNDRHFRPTGVSTLNPFRPSELATSEPSMLAN